MSLIAKGNLSRTQRYAINTAAFAGVITAAACSGSKPSPAPSPDNACAAARLMHIDFQHPKEGYLAGDQTYRLQLDRNNLAPNGDNTGEDLAQTAYQENRGGQGPATLSGPALVQAGNWIERQGSICGVGSDGEPHFSIYVDSNSTPGHNESDAVFVPIVSPQDAAASARNP